MVYEVQTLDAHGVPASEYLYQPEHLRDLEGRYAPSMKLVQQGEQDKLNRVPPCFPTSAEYLRGYKAPGAHYITEIQDHTSERSHFLITLIHRETREEKLVDLLTDAYGFATIRTILNCHFDHGWGVFEVLDIDAPF